MKKGACVWEVRGEGEEKQNNFISRNVYETEEKALHSSSNVLPHSSFFYIKLENMHTWVCFLCDQQKAASSGLLLSHYVLR